MVNDIITNKSAARTIEILELLAFSNKPLTMAEIGRSLALPKSSCFEILHTLLEKDVIKLDEKDKTFHLGIKLFQIGATVFSKTDLNNAARSSIIKLAKDTGETVYLAVEDKGEIVYLDKVESEEPIRSTLPIGSRNSMHITGLGKALLATYSFEKVKKLVGEGELLTKTKFSINHFNALEKDLEMTRQRGYAVDDREGTEYLRCLAAPILNYNGEAVAAISIAALDYRLTDENIPRFADKVVKAALEISKKLGYNGEKLY